MDKPCSLDAPINDDEDSYRIDTVAVAERLENLFRQSLHSTTRTEFMEALHMIGYMRGGECCAGSPVWADCREFSEDDCYPVAQIFGHT